MQFLSHLFQNSWFVALFGGAITVVLVWGYSLFQRASIQSMQLARNGETTDEENLSLYYYSSPPLIPCFALGAVVSFLVWYFIRKGVSVSPIVSAFATAKVSDVVLPAAKVDVVPSTIAAVVTQVTDAVKQVVAPSAPVIKNGLANF